MSVEDTFLESGCLGQVSGIMIRLKGGSPGVVKYVQAGRVKLELHWPARSHSQTPAAGQGKMFMAVLRWAGRCGVSKFEREEWGED